MENERVDRLLRGLPPEVASAGFTARVLARLDDPAPRESKNWLPRITLPAAALAATIVVAASLLSPARPPLAPIARSAPSAPLAQAAPTPLIRVAMAPARQARGAPLPRSTAAAQLAANRTQARRLLDQISDERGRLEGELRALRKAPASPVIYLGGDEDMDLVVDMAKVRNLPAGRQGRRPGDPPGFD